MQARRVAWIVGLHVLAAVAHGQAIDPMAGFRAIDADGILSILVGGGMSASLDASMMLYLPYRLLC